MASRKGMKGEPVVGPEERGRGERRIRRGPAGGADKFDGGGFETGTHGRGPTPFQMHHTKKPGGHSLAAHAATSGRGGDGVFGKPGQFKGAAGDVVHPQSHADFEGLGATED